MNDYLKHFEKSMKQHGKSANTIATYTRNAELFIQWLESVTGEQFNGRITDLDVTEYTRYLSDVCKQSLNTIKSKLTAIQKLSDYLSHAGTMPAIKVQQKKGSYDPDVEILEKNELYKYLRYTINTENLMNIAIVQLILNTGIRAAELCSLELSDLDISERKGTVTIRSGKYNKYRVIPLNKAARNALTDYLTKCRPADAESEKVFIGQRGAIQRNGVYKIVRKLGEKSIGKVVYPHMLRHQCLTTMAKNPDVDLKTVSSIAGHRNPEITIRYYINSSRQEKTNAVDSLSFFS